MESSMQDKLVEWDAKTGWPDDLYEHVLRSISAFHRRYKYIYVGITNNAERRFYEHVQRDVYVWDRMIVKYQSTSVRNTNVLEGYFIQSDKTVNRYMGWSNMSPDCPAYYLYILLGNKKR